MRHRALRRLATALTVTAVAIVGMPTPAHACSCSPPDIDLAVAAGGAVAIVTRLDHGDDPATFAVEDVYGPPLPDRLHGELDTSGGSCKPWVQPGGVAALVFTRSGLGWQLGSCAQVDLGTALQRAQGNPAAEAGGPAMAVAAGAFGGSRLAVLDAKGTVTAWDGLPGEGVAAAPCPAGQRVAAVGRTAALRYEDTALEVTVHDAASLRTRRAVTLPTDPYSRVLAMRCRDRDADTVDVLVTDYIDAGRDAGRLLTVTAGRVTSRDLGPVTNAVPVAGGFLAVVGERTPSIMKIGDDGSRETVARAPGLDYIEWFAVSADGRTIAAYGQPGKRRTSAVRTFDVTTGERLGGWDPKGSVIGLAWAGSNRLLVRVETGYRVPAAPLVVLDRALHRLDTRPATVGYSLTSIRNLAVTFNGARMTLVPAAGSPRVLDSLRLAAAVAAIAL